ncbi:MAG: thermonuclease family protein [Acidobacteriota bacterium]
MRRRFHLIAAIISLSLFPANIISQSLQIVSRVIDGDTLELQGGERVRLIGINTPELDDSQQAAFAMEARGFLRGLAEGKKVRLEYDQDKDDMYDRTLAYLYLEDGTFINAEIVKQGYSEVYTAYPFKYLKEFQLYEKQAREARKGIWASSRLTPKRQQAPIQVAPKNSPPANRDQIVYVTRTGSKYHRDGCRYLSKSKIPMPLKEAARRYGPCSVCRPPVL